MSNYFLTYLHIRLFSKLLNMKLPTIGTTQTVINHKECGMIVRRARAKANLSLLDLADELSVSSPFLSDLERGNRNWSEGRFHQAMKIIASKK